MPITIEEVYNMMINAKAESMQFQQQLAKAIAEKDELQKRLDEMKTAIKNVERS
jgi:chaperonin cofactor prefoldin